MAKDCSFDIVSKIELPAVRNAINTTLKEIKTRYDFKGSMSDVKLEEETLVLVSDDNFKLEQLTDVLVSKLIKQNVPTRNLDYGKVENAFSGNVRQRVKLIQGIDNDNAKKINNLIKESKVKVKTQLQDDQLRVTGKNRDDLQQVIALVRGAELPIDVQFTNYR